MTFTIIIDYDPEERVFNVSVPALPGCFTWGKSKQKALKHAKEVIAAYLEVAARYGDPIQVATVRIP